jgi:hypothetical protein
MAGMSLRLSALLLFTSGAGLLFACNSTLESFQCERSADCEREGESDGRCEPTQFCSFSDPSCGDDDARRYGEASGDRSNQCVGGEDDEVDASVANPGVDADTDGRDAGTTPPIDADITVNAPDAADSCVFLNMLVYDNYEGNDKVKVQVNGDTELTCDPDAVTQGSDAIEACQYCMPVGATIKLKAESGDRFQFLTTDCANNCENDKECVFTASDACNSVHYFDVDYTMLPPST